MQRLARFSLDHPVATLVATAAVTLCLALGVPRLELRTDGEALHPVDDPTVEQTLRDRLRFREPRVVLLVVSVRSETATLASPAGFRFLRDLHVGLRRLDVLQGQGIESVAGRPRLVRGAGGVSAGAQLDAIPEDEEEFAALLAEVQARPWTDGLLLSSDGRRALFGLPLAESVGVASAVRAIERFCEDAASSDYSLTLGGPLIAETTLGARVLRDLAVLVPLMLVVIAGLLFVMLRTPGGVLLPLLETGIVLIWTFGAMGWLGAPIALVTTILPVVLMAMCITDEIHLLERLAGSWQRGAPRARIEAALAGVGRPIVLTSLTTALGFLSFTSASIAPLREFGFFAAVGILAAMLLTFSLIPALILLAPERLFAPRGPGTGLRGLQRYASLATRRPLACFVLAIAAVGVAVPGAARLRVSDSWVGNFDPDDAVARAEREIDASFWGSYRYDVVFVGAPGAFRDPPGAALVEDFVSRLPGAPFVGGAQSYLAPLEEIAAVLGESGPLSELPAPKLWDLLTLAEMSEGRAGLAPLLTSSGDAARVRLYVKRADHAKARVLDAHVAGILDALDPTAGVTAHASGDLPLAAALVDAIVRDQLRSIAWALATVSGLLLLFSRRLSALWALVPVLASLSVLFGLMGWCGIELGIATSMFASLTVGVGVDFGIHFLHRFERERSAGRDGADAVSAAIGTAGRALYWNAAVLAAGFSVLMASSLKPNHSLGLLLVGAILLCFGSTFLLLPWLLTLRPHRSLASWLLVVLVMGASQVRAEPPGCDGAADPAAERIMGDLEHRARTTARIQRMQIETHYRPRSRGDLPSLSPLPRTIWSVMSGDAEESWLLFVFSAPGRMAGTSLLLRDAADPQQPDGVWFYLRAFDHFEKLGAGALRVVVPGTALTYEDARGFLAIDRYRFRMDETGAGAVPGAEPAPLYILGCPRTPEIADALGYAAVRVEVDPVRQVVRRIDYHGPGGALQKTWEMREAAALGAWYLPARVLLTQHAQGFENRIHYEHWRLASTPPRGLFRPDLEPGPFLDRLQRLLHAHGLGERIDAEIAEADARVRTWEERYGTGSDE